MRTSVLSAVRAAIVLAVVGGFGLLVQRPWLFPSLGPTALMRAQTPEAPNARAWNALIGHLFGAIAGAVSVFAFGVQSAPGVLATGHLSASRLAAASLAIALSAVAGRAARAPHPPAASTALLFAEGSYRSNWRDLLLVVTGTALTVGIGELLDWRRKRARGAVLAMPRKHRELRTDERPERG